jgi:hypothetical protein
MGMEKFVNYIKSQLLDVIEWEDSSQDTIVHKIDMQNNESKMVHG